MWTIGLRKCRFIARHGVYKYEQEIIDQEFEVNLHVTLNHSDPISNLNDTINYEILYAIVSEEMNAPKALLEEVINCIVAKIKTRLSEISSIEISIEKLNPQFGKSIGATIVKYSWP